MHSTPASFAISGMGAVALLIAAAVALVVIVALALIAVTVFGTVGRSVSERRENERYKRSLPKDN